MCDISKITDLKSVIVYKTVRKLDCGGFQSPFTFTTIKEGLVSDKKMYMSTADYYDYTPGSHLYNSNMIGRVSGFEKLSDAVKLLCHLSDAEILKNVRFGVSYFYHTSAILKIELRSYQESDSYKPIMEGTVRKIARIEENPDNKTFAGPVINKIEVLPVEAVEEAYNQYRAELKCAT